MCKRLPDLPGVNMKCYGPEGKIVANDKVLEDGECKLECEEEGLKIVEEYKILPCKEVDGKMTFTRSNDSNPIVIETLKNINLCPGRAPAIHAIVTIGHMCQKGV